jgi:hypothetical protein
MKKKKYTPIFIFTFLFFFCLSFSGCTNLSQKNIETKYDYIQSYPGGGGIFPIHLRLSDSDHRNIHLDFKCDHYLKPQFSQKSIKNNTCISNLIIKPSEMITEGNYKILLTSKNDYMYEIKIIEVEIFNGSNEGPSNYILEKRDTFLSWIETRYPEYHNLLNQTWFPYRTYSNILVVEHWTFLSSEYELRICSHITTPPYNWSKMMIRSLNQIQSDLAIHQEYNGSVSEISITEYPTFYGY